MRDVHEHTGAAKVTGDIGEQIDKTLTAAKDAAARLHGGRSALREVAGKVSASVGEHAKDAYQRGEFEGLEAQRVHEVVMGYVRRAAECALNLSDKYQSDALVAEGKVVALRAVLDTIGKYHNVHVERVKQLTAPAEPEPEGSDDAPRLTRSGRVSVAERRQSGSAVNDEPYTSDDSVNTAAESPKPSQTKRTTTRRRPKKSSKRSKAV